MTLVTRTDELAALDATAQAALVRQGELTPGELVDAAIVRIERVNPALNAVIHPRFERARAEASEAAPGPFRGVPIVVKDLDGSLAGEPLHLGNRLLRDLDHRGDHDSFLFTKLRAAGFVVVGKTNAPEFGLLPTTEPLAHGPTRNPWDPERSPGGSSGGTGAAVAAGMVPVGHAGDGGGSIRIPASACGLVGLKPSRGRVSLGPAEGEAWSGLVTRHVLTRSVRDCAAVLDLLAGAMPGDPYAAAPPARPYRDELRADVGRLRVGVRASSVPGDLVSVDAACAAAATDAAALLEALGHDVTDASPAALDEVELVEVFFTIMAVATARDVERLAALAGRAIGPDDVEPFTWAQSEAGRAVAATDFASAIERASAWSRRMACWWDAGAGGFDVLLTPTMAALPARLGEIRGDDAEGAVVAAIPYAAFTVPSNVTGQPAISVPFTWHDGLPIGVQLVAATGREDVVLRLAAQLEAAQPWAGHRPPITA
jgi:amidase